MDGMLVEVVCPNCAFGIRTAAYARKERFPRCPRCGAYLGAEASVGASSGGFDADKTAILPTDLTAVDQELIADLRNAFDFVSGPPAAVGSEPLGASSAGGDAFEPVLRRAKMPTPSRFGDFELISELGRGGMGVVYRARQVSLGREVALKVLPIPSRHGEAAVQRFRTEAQAAARLHHTNIVPVYSQGEEKGRFYYAMELVEGVGLDAIIRSGPSFLSSTRRKGGSSAAWASDLTVPLIDEADGIVQPSEDEDATRTDPKLSHADYRHIASLVAEVADGLDCAHRHGVIHRDVKPQNLLFGENERLHLTDFGLARLTDEPHLTQDAEVMGTPAYLSPEQIRGDTSQVDHRTDVYSLGVTLYELITGIKPFEGQSRDQIIRKICDTEATAPRRLVPHIPVDLETICLRAMDKAQARRHATAGLLADDLRRFAEGRPILSRRTGRVEKAVKWMRRHKAQTAAMAAAVAVVLLSAGWSWSVRVADAREAARLVSAAYEHLAYSDYHAHERVSEDIERAASLGADETDVDLTRALSCLGAADQRAAIEHLRAVLDADPTDARALYLMSWAQWRGGDRANARRTWERAEASSAPLEADASFFRGLAIHFEDPAAAMESYERAITTRSREGAFYPQAVLHLARARNQQLYATRSLDTFSDATASLHELIKYEYYGARPHYLLSISHRLAAEIYRGSEGTREQAGLVSHHFGEALRWARLGQEVDPTFDRPVTAEAECLESMGLFREAIEARTRAIAVAEADLARWEGYHYRWRLHYWTGSPEAALDDLSVAAGYDPGNRFYEHVYPAIVLADDDLAAALAHARAIAGDSALSVIWAATTLRLLGHDDEAAALLTERAEDVDYTFGLVPPQSEAWVRSLYGYMMGSVPLDSLAELAEGTAAPWALLGEAHFHGAAMKLARGDKNGAWDEFRRSFRSFDRETRYTFHSKVIHTRLQQDTTWPAWLSFGGEDAKGARSGHRVE